MLNFDCPAPICKFAQSARDVKGHGHNHLFVRRDLVFETDFARDDVVVGDALGSAGDETPDASSTKAVRTQVTAGNPSSIFCHVLPSSREPKICPFRVPK